MIEQYQSQTMGQMIPRSAGESKHTHNLQQVSLRELKLRNNETEQAIKAVQARINYMKTKQQRTVKKVMNVKRKLTSLQNVKAKARQMKEVQQQEKRKAQESQSRKAEFNKLIKDHLKYNKKIVMTLMSHKVGEQTRAFKQKQDQLQVLTQVQRQNLKDDNAQKANKVRLEHIDAHQKRKLYFLDKLQQFKQFKQQKLREQLKERERQESMISDLQQKQRMLLERLSMSQKFRMKCQQEYQEARAKYHSFYEASRNISRAQSPDNEGKADIFIS